MCAGQSKKSGRVRPETSLKSRVASRTPLSAARLASSSPGAWTRESPMIHRRTGSSGVGFLGTEVVVGASSGTFVVVGGGGSGGGGGGGGFRPRATSRPVRGRSSNNQWLAVSTASATTTATGRYQVSIGSAQAVPAREAALKNPASASPAPIP